MKFSDVTAGARLICPGRPYRRPKISILTPTYKRNAEGLLAKCLASAMAQTFDDFEHVIVDDGSSDGSEFTIRDAALRDDRIVYWRHETNSNLPGLRTDECILRSRGDAVAFLFDDNVLRPDFIETAWRAMENSGADVVYGHVYMLGNEGKDFTLGGWPLTLELLRNLNTIPNGGVLVRRSYFDRFGLYDPHILMRRLCDWDLWLRGLMLGAKFCHVAQVFAVEHGLISENSIGNTIDLDIKVTYAYMQDDAGMRERTQRLIPSAIDDFEVLDPSPLLPYVRNETEWSELTDTMYAPYFKRREKNGFDPSFPTNRAASLDPHTGWNAPWSPIKARRRCLIVSNSVNPWALGWINALRKIPGMIALNCPEWQLAGFRPCDLDVLILLDCSSPFLNPQLDAFRAASVPIIYVLAYGAQQGDAPPDLANRFFEQSGHIVDVLGHDMYFPQAGAAFGDLRREYAGLVIPRAHLLLAMPSGAQRLSLSDVIPFPFDSVVNSPAARTSPGAVISYGQGAADVEDVTECVALPVDSYVPGSNPYIRPSWEGLGALAETRPGSRIIADPAIVYASPLPERVGVAAIAQRFDVSLSQPGALCAGETVNPDATPDAWLDWMANVARGALLAREVAVASGGQPTRLCVGIFLNSEMFSGSEVYGLMLARALSQIGYRVQVFVPEQTVYGNDADAAPLNAWLSAHGFEAARPAPYRAGVGYLMADPATQSDMVACLSTFVSAEQHDVVICCGMLPIFAALPNRVLLFMALFQPTAYRAEDIAFLRGRVTGVMSDSEWSLTAHCRHVGGTSALVRAMLPVEADPASPRQPRTGGSIAVALGGTLQPRKRQLQAIEAIGMLRDRGIAVTLNVYGYTLDMMRGYVDEINAAVARHHLQGVVRLHGLVRMQDIARNNDVVLMASVDESMPQTLVDMMRLGLIGVSGLSGGIDELIEDGKTGYLTTDLSPRGLAGVLARAIEDRSRWPEVAAEARSRIAAEYSIGRNTARLLDLMIEGAQIEKSPYGRLALS